MNCKCEGCDEMTDNDICPFCVEECNPGIIRDDDGGWWPTNEIMDVDDRGAIEGGFISAAADD